MRISGNTILITGGGSGIGLALGEQLARRGNRIVAAGRSARRLEAAAQRGFETLAVDMSDAASIAALGRTALERWPGLNVVIHNAGVMRYENLRKGSTEATILETVATKLTGPMLLTEALLPHLLEQPYAAIVTVSSGLAFMPLAMTPTYCATKAAIHSYTESLRYQLRETRIEVIELVPPYVQTELMGPRQASDPMAMPLDEYIAEVMAILDAQPNVTEVLVERVRSRRFAASGGQEQYDAFFREFNQRYFAARAQDF